MSIQKKRMFPVFVLSTFMLASEVTYGVQQQNTVALNGTKPGNGICQSIAVDVRKTSSYSQLISTMRRFEKQLPECGETLKKDVQLNQHVKKLSQQEKQHLKTKLQKTMASKSRVIPPQKLKINQRLASIKAEGRRRLARLKASSSSTKHTTELNNVSRPNANSPVSATITPTTIVPGLFAVIEGNGIHFGNSQGSVELVVGNRVIPATINSWRHDWISVQFPEDISGLPISRTNAAVIVRNGDLGARTHIDVDFIPVFERIEVWDAYSHLVFPPDIFNIAGSSGDVTLFGDAVLDMHWHVSDFHVFDIGSGSCQHRTPFITQGGNRLSSKIHWTRGWGETLSCSIVAGVEGPRGVPSGTDDLHKN